MNGDPSIHDINAIEAVGEHTSEGKGETPSSDCVVTYQNEAAKKHPYNKEQDAKTIFIHENGTVIYSF